MNPTFEYCAVRYLDVWLRKESILVQGIKSPTPEAIRAGLAHFNVSRGFAGIDDPKISKKVVRLLLSHDRYITPKTAPMRVVDLADALERDLGYDNLLSAASKLLWLRSRSPFVIFDKRAADALQLEGRDFQRRDYDSYCRAWRNAYSDRQDSISRALAELPRFVEFTAAAHLGRAYIVELASQEWFAERVFDQYLWLVGVPKKASGVVALAADV